MLPVSAPVGLSAFDPSILGDRFRNEVWSDLPYRAEFLALQDTRLSRRHVIDAYRHDISKGVVWTIVWGYPHGKISQYDGDKEAARRAIMNADRFAEVIAEIKAGPVLLASTLIGKLNAVSNGAGTSTTSKIAYFAGLLAKEGPCLIFDRQVIKAIVETSDPAFAGLGAALTSTKASNAMTSADRIKLVTAAQHQFYGPYLAAINDLSFKLGKRFPRDLIEQYLFAKGRGSI